jgi:uncharacterized protein (TIGR02588 family)
MSRKPVRKSLKERTPIAEWTAAGLGLALTLGVIGYSVWEGLSSGSDRPSLSIEVGAAEPSGGRYLAPITLRNDAHATAAAVEVRGVLRAGDAVVEERRTVFTYVPGKGQARGGLVFDHDPRAYDLRVTPEGYEEP